MKAKFDPFRVSFDEGSDDIGGCFPFGWRPAEHEPGSVWATRQRMLMARIDADAKATVQRERDKYKDPLWFSWNSMRERGEM